MSEDWQTAWEPMIAAIGEDFSGGNIREAADDVERGMVRRYLEPLEFDCPLHHDEAVAREHGYRGVVAPYSGLFTWGSAPIWSPGGRPVWTSAERNAQPDRRRNTGRPTPAPPTTGFFATDIEIEYLQPVIVGDHLTSSGRKLLSCMPKETSVGKGAFLIWESEVRNQHGELVAKVRSGSYDYNPHPRGDDPGS